MTNRPHVADDWSECPFRRAQLAFGVLAEAWRPRPPSLVEIDGDRSLDAESSGVEHAEPPAGNELVCTKSRLYRWLRNWGAMLMRTIIGKMVDGFVMTEGIFALVKQDRVKSNKVDLQTYPNPSVINAMLTAT